MILTYAVPIPEVPLLQRMREATPCFILTGSRRFGGARPDSDWDFIAMRSPELTEFINAENGPLREMHDKFYGGDGVTHYVHTFKDGPVTVQVQEVDQGLLDLKIRMAEAVNSCVHLRTLDKSFICKRHRASFWRLLGELLSMDPHLEIADPSPF